MIEALVHYTSHTNAHYTHIYYTLTRHITQEAPYLALSNLALCQTLGFLPVCDRSVNAVVVSLQVWYQCSPISVPTTTWAILCVLTSDKETGWSSLSVIEWWSERDQCLKWEFYRLKGPFHPNDNLQIILKQCCGSSAGGSVVGSHVSFPEAHPTLPHSLLLWCHPGINLYHSPGCNLQTDVEVG